MFTQLTWVALTEMTSFGHFIPIVFIFVKMVQVHFLVLFNLSVCNRFLLDSIFHTFQGKRAPQIISFRLDLMKQLINCFRQRKRKQRSQEALKHQVAHEEHVSIHVESRKRKCIQCIKDECNLCWVRLLVLTHKVYHGASIDQLDHLIVKAEAF